MTSDIKLTAEDFSNGVKGRWCAGCGDFGVHSSLKKAMAELGIPPSKTILISGIGCSSRMAYHLNGYCFHTIHGRPIAIASGCKIANPEMNVWTVCGDGDSMAIGGNHFIHALRRNVNINIVLLNNRIYGLTKGQYSPTSERGFISKSSPYGTVEDPFRPSELIIGASGEFFARCVATDGPGSVKCLTAASRHKGTAVVEMLTNCVTFNNGSFDRIYSKEGRDENALYLEDGKPMLFGKNKEYGIVQHGFDLKVVKVGEGGYTLNDILVHDSHCTDRTLHTKLSSLEGPDFPIVLGVIRDVSIPTYEEEIEKQIEEISAKKSYHNFEELMKTQHTWTIK
ncbi:MAG: 2-oxoacid:ferredoxin oxidoreductase subunit beta [Prevotellaceae bacterium]|nr:2-oxoacid:ferredoxin oxidoreductase subunit beta [Prevotellaceae bacterium]MDD7107827.1 2-oxoacid:ferredoxin oxidoreductase subunit beta [Prevotellaceae bacterium]MDY3294586.1 2-oxoacid:ferredoxin oxidoreductase subunit beta [Bacteroidaceae bacterium]